MLTLYNYKFLTRCNIEKLNIKIKFWFMSKNCQFQLGNNVIISNFDLHLKLLIQDIVTTTHS